MESSEASVVRPSYNMAGKGNGRFHFIWYDFHVVNRNKLRSDMALANDTHEDHRTEMASPWSLGYKRYAKEQSNRALGKLES